MIFRLFESIRFVRGYNRTALLDLSREKILFLPTDFADLLQKINGKSRHEEILELHFPEDHLEYLQFIEENEIGFLCTSKEAKRFDLLSMEWKNPAIITNAIVEVGDDINLELFSLLTSLGCQNLELQVISEKGIIETLEFLNDSICKNIVLVYRNPSQFKFKHTTINKRVNETHVFDATAISVENSTVFFHPYAFEKRAKVPSTTNFLAVNLTLFLESIGNNVYLNRKLFIDRFGKIKNAPETSKTIYKGTQIIALDELTKRIKSDEFTNLWNLPKSEIDVCSDCEFRHCCVCMRIPKQRADKTWYYPVECDYNPYLSKWKHERNYRNLMDSGVVCTPKEMKIDQNKLAKVFDKVWGE